MGPHIILSLILALELDDASPDCFQCKVPPLRSPLEKVAPGPRRNILEHIQHHICKFKNVKKGRMIWWAIFLILLSLIPMWNHFTSKSYPIIEQKLKAYRLTLFLFSDCPSYMPTLHLQHHLLQSPHNKI